MDSTWDFFIQNGMNYECFKQDMSLTERSQVTIMVKNIAWQTTKDKLKSVFERHGKIKHLFMHPENTVAII